MDVLIVDDHSIVRHGLKSMLESVYPHWRFHHAENGAQGILVASRVKPDLIFMDYMMPKLDGIKASAAILRNLPKAKIIILTMYAIDDIFQLARDAGVKRILSKDITDNEMLQVIQDLLEGRGSIMDSWKQLHSMRTGPAPLTMQELQHDFFGNFSQRENEVLQLLMKGYSSEKIASQLNISCRTVEGHRLSIMKKCEVHSVSQLMTLLVRKKVFRND
jgi:DNA-binding NarL/FixJ family response regulator